MAGSLETPPTSTPGLISPGALIHVKISPLFFKEPE